MEREIRDEIKTKQAPLDTIQQKMINKYKLETENYYEDIDKRVDDLVNDTDKLLEYINILHDRRDIKFEKGAEYFSNKIDVLIDTYMKFKSVKREFLETQADVVFNIVMNIWHKRSSGHPEQMKFLGSATRQGQTYLHFIALSSALNTQLDKLATDLTKVEDYIMEKLKGSLPLRMYLHNKRRNKAKEAEWRKAKEEEEAHRKAKEEEAEEEAHRKVKEEEARHKAKEEKAASAEPQRKSNPFTKFFRNLCYGPGCSRSGGARRSIHKKSTHNRMATRKKRSLKKGTKRRQRGGG